MTRTTLALILAAGLSAFPQELPTDAIVRVGRATWPGDITVGVVCDHARSGARVRALQAGFAPGSRILVVDARHPEHLTRACMLLGQAKPEFVLLLPDDPLVHDGSPEAYRVIQSMTARNIPTLATTPAALAQGAWAVAGPATGGVLQVNPALTGSIEVDWKHSYPTTTVAAAGARPAASGRHGF